MSRGLYEVFEHQADGSLVGRGRARGLIQAHIALRSLADRTGNECLAMDSERGEITLARAPVTAAKRIFQIAYSHALASRAHLLRAAGFDVTSASGNDVAMFLLQEHSDFDLFIIGHAASDPERLSMANWLRTHYPHTDILALNACGYLVDGVHFNPIPEPAADWLPVIAAALQSPSANAHGE